MEEEELVVVEEDGDNTLQMKEEAGDDTAKGGKIWLVAFGGKLKGAIGGGGHVASPTSRS